MCEEEKEKPDWLSDLQNNQKHKERENFETRLDLNNPVLAYASPRYGRRSVPGTKSVDNSPTKSSSNENKSNSARSNSARPSLRASDDFICEVKETSNAFNKSLQVLRDDFEKLSLHTLSKSRRRNVSPKNFCQTWTSPWNSFGMFSDSSRRKRSKSPEKKQINVNVRSSQEKSKKGDRGDRGEIQRFESVEAENDFGKVGRTEGTETRRQEFIIPELPQGQYLVINVKSTWGDKHFLGLNGIEIFNSKGIKPQIKSISGNLDNFNSTKEAKYFENLIDNIYLTQDDRHMWMAPFTPYSSHFIFIEFDKTEELAMLRIWNYNKSRIHRYRGVKDVEIKLDNKFIFIGEVAMASGEILSTLSNFGDTILFTTDEDILESVAKNDEYFESNTFYALDDSLSKEEMRPLTGSNGNFLRSPEQLSPKDQIKFPEGNHDFLDVRINSDRVFNQTNLITFAERDKDNGENGNKEGGTLKGSSKAGEARDAMKKRKLPQDTETGLCFGDEIPSTSDDAQTVKVKEGKASEKDSIYAKVEFFDDTGTLYIPSVCAAASDSAYETLSMPTGFNFTIQIHSTWGDLYYVGLNGVQIFDENGVEIKLHPENVHADPEGVNILDGIENDARTPDKLIDGVYDTMDGCHMWLAPVLPLTINRVELTFQRPVTLSAMKLWNYSKTPGRGVREFGILVDGLLIYNGELNQAPGIGSDGLPRIPCKTINFTDSGGRKNNEDFITPQRTETFGGTLQLVDQSKRPLTTMTSHNN